MKEATGELSMTAIVVVIIAILAVVGPVIVRSVGNSIQRRTNCQAAYGCGTCTNGTRSCSYTNDKGTEISGLICDCKTADDGSSTINT